jgi:hypothetical protein
MGHVVLPAHDAARPVAGGGARRTNREARQSYPAPVATAGVWSPSDCCRDLARCYLKMRAGPRARFPKPGSTAGLPARADLCFRARRGAEPGAWRQSRRSRPHRAGSARPSDGGSPPQPSPDEEVGPNTLQTRSASRRQPHGVHADHRRHALRAAPRGHLPAPAHRGPQIVASECGTSLKMLSEHYSLPIEDLRHHEPRPADIE